MSLGIDLSAMEKWTQTDEYKELKSSHDALLEAAKTAEYIMTKLATKVEKDSLEQALILDHLEDIQKAIQKADKK